MKNSQSLFFQYIVSSGHCLSLNMKDKNERGKGWKLSSEKNEQGIFNAQRLK
jgi:hypothetical protein